MNTIKKYSLVFIFLVTLTTLILSILLFGGYIQEANLPPVVVTITQKVRELAMPKPELFKYIEIIESCDPYYKGECVTARSGPDEKYPIIARLRTGIVLKVADTVTKDNRDWYKIEFEKTIRYPERITTEWFIPKESVHLIEDDGDHEPNKTELASSTKRIVIDRSEQMLYAYDKDTLFMQTTISTGVEFAPTPHGTFNIYRMTPSRYMQGPIPGASSAYYDLPGVPWNLYFTSKGDVIHGAYWHNKFGSPQSQGCVNLPPDQAKKLYMWADIGTTVIVQA
ncbi:MAG: L,D-transpeptidase family protein [Candidatus Paceibacterota bacterium]|jgi:lipoprotein-anchoring transpeptidase ErfK/SrfK